MTCKPFNLGNGVTGFVCTRGSKQKRCQTPHCGRSASKRCDYPVTRNGKTETCDRCLCSLCAVSQGVNRDYCGPHARASEKVSP